MKYAIFTIWKNGMESVFHAYYVEKLGGYIIYEFPDDKGKFIDKFHVRRLEPLNETNESL